MGSTSTTFKLVLTGRSCSYSRNDKAVNRSSPGRALLPKMTKYRLFLFAGTTPTMDWQESWRLRVRQSQSRKLAPLRSCRGYLSLAESTGENASAEYRLPVDSRAGPRHVSVAGLPRCIQTLIVQLVGFHLFDKTDASPFLLLVDHDSGAPRRWLATPNATGRGNRISRSERHLP